MAFCLPVFPIRKSGQREKPEGARKEYRLRVQAEKREGLRKRKAAKRCHFPARCSLRVRANRRFFAASVAPPVIRTQASAVVMWCQPMCSPGRRAEPVTISRARSDHIRIALNPISVARIGYFLPLSDSDLKVSRNFLGFDNRISA